MKNMNPTAPHSTIKKVAIIQSNYIPWKGYFDMINMVDEFILYDDCQYTKNDWRNRNKIKTPNGLIWLSIPVRHKGLFGQRICEVEISDKRWTRKHWNTIKTYYGKAKYFNEVGLFFQSLYQRSQHIDKLSQINHFFIREIARSLGINTEISFSMDYKFSGNQTDNLISILQQTNANVYLSGPSAKSYINEQLFEESGIEIEWKNYSGYPEYEQLYPPFRHEVSIVDLLMNVGIKGAKKYMTSS